MTVVRGVGGERRRFQTQMKASKPSSTRLSSSGRAQTERKTSGPPSRPSRSRKGGRATLATFMVGGGRGRGPLPDTGHEDPVDLLFSCWPCVRAIFDSLCSANEVPSSLFLASRSWMSGQNLPLRSPLSRPSSTTEKTDSNSPASRWEIIDIDRRARRGTFFPGCTERTVRDSPVGVNEKRTLHGTPKLQDIANTVVCDSPAVKCSPHDKEQPL